MPLTWPTVASTAVRISRERHARLIRLQRCPAPTFAGAALHRLHRVLGAGLDLADQLADRLGLALGALGQLADLIRDHREATTMLARPGRLDGRVQGQQVGLLGDVVDGLDDRPRRALPAPRPSGRFLDAGLAPASQ